MMRESVTLVDGLTFPEGPRWHEGKLYFSDFFTLQVYAVDASGHCESILEVTKQPSGLGWLPDGTLLVVSMIDQKVLCYKNNILTEYADCSEYANFHCNDMIVSSDGNAYVGNFGFNGRNNESIKSTNLILIRPNEKPIIAASDLYFPNGTIITEDNKTLIIAETYAARLTAFDINDDGSLSNRRLWADLKNKKKDYTPVPDGICIDKENAIWMASPSTREVLRIKEGGVIIDRISVQTNAYACVLGGKDRRTLFVCTSGSSDMQSCIEKREGKIESFQVEIPGVGIP